MEKLVIHEVIVVEGRDDTTAIHRAADADTIETNGSALSATTIEKIRHAKEKRGVIILTDPDFPGEKIRKQIDAAVPGCHHAFIKRSDALPKYGRGLGVEHAKPAVIQEALQHFHTSDERTTTSDIDYERLVMLGLMGGAGAKAKRQRLGEILKIGYTNGKQLQARLRMFGITSEQFEAAWGLIVQEETNE
ncbi:ribonuclease M5 [Listeria grandensis]|uniref:Ribonuclease M5 n=1 Tax=Listeria grandensis TaxID=1494963 RepID=A0A7X1CPH8_9LIST|nr:ribonuclease M5 [Listeria grandensis]MBC1936025.1 ribonuclease M5 [Listeria grandensis]MBC6316158.1 ribonuclease M5 [Listeria grandensis]